MILFTQPKILIKPEGRKTLQNKYMGKSSVCSNICVFKLQFLHQLSTQIEKKIKDCFEALRNKISNFTFYF